MALALIATVCPACTIRPILLWVEASSSKFSGRSSSPSAMTGTPAAAMSCATSHPSLAPTSAMSSRGNSFLSASTLRMSEARSTATSSSCSPRTTGTSADASNRVSNTSPARSAYSPDRRGSTGTSSPKSVSGRADDRPGMRASSPSFIASRSALRNRTCAATRLPPAIRPPCSPNATIWKARGRITALGSAPRSMIAPWPAKMEADGDVVVAARVTPAARWTRMCCELGLTAGATSSAALKGELRAELSFDSPTPPTSSRPSVVIAATIPGVTQAPWPSIAVAPPEAGIPDAGPA